MMLNVFSCAVPHLSIFFGEMSFKPLPLKHWVASLCCTALRGVDIIRAVNLYTYVTGKYFLPFCSLSLDILNYINYILWYTTFFILMETGLHIFSFVSLSSNLRIYCQASICEDFPHVFIEEFYRFCFRI